MWDRRNLPLVVAVCLSVLLHVVTIGGLKQSGIGPRNLTIDTGNSAGKGRHEVTYTISLADSAPEPPKNDPAEPKKSDKPDPPKDPPKPPQVKKPEPPKPQRPKIEKYPDEMGEKTGSGNGSQKAVGDELIKAREADEDQAFLSRDPAGPGRVGGPPSEWLHSPGENGRGGSPGSATPFPQATPTPPARQARPADAPAATVSEPVPPAAVGEANPNEANPNKANPAEPLSEPAPPPPAARPMRLALALPRPAEPQPKPDLHVGPLEIAPRPAAAPPVPGDSATVGEGDKGVRNDQLPPPDLSVTDPTLPRPATRPSRTPGHLDGSDGTGGALQLAIPRISPAQPQDPAEAPAKPARPALALFTAPAPPAPTPAPMDFAIRPPRDPQDSKADRKTAPNPAKPVLPPVLPKEAARRTPTPTPAAPASPATPTVAAPRLAQATGDGRRPGAPRPAADPAQMSDSESDAFSKIGSVQFRDGRLDVRFGRKVKTVRPHIPIVGQIDSMTLRNPSVTLKVSIDETGKVTQVAVHKSSGSNAIDTPCLEAMYDWWFEPLTDASGKPIPDVVLFTINFR